MSYEIVNDKEFDREKEKFCPQCYFEDDLKVLRTECKHGNSLQKQVDDLASFLMKNFPDEIQGDGAIGTAMQILTKYKTLII